MFSDREISVVVINLANCVINSAFPTDGFKEFALRFTVYYLQEQYELVQMCSLICQLRNIDFQNGYLEETSCICYCVMYCG